MGWWKSLPTSARMFLRLTTADRWTLVQAGFLLPITAVAFRFLGFRRWQATLQRWAGAHPCWACHADTDCAARACRIAWLVEVAARFVIGRDSCLAQSLVLCWLLRRRGLEGKLHIGVRKNGDRLQAHAWVVYRHVVLNDGVDVSDPFVPFDKAIVPLESGSA
jgi:hypothetical protein